MRAYLWGGGGGGGGADSARGGTGGGGGFAEVNFTISAGDVLSVAVGGSGGPGENGATGRGGGSAGGSYDTQSTIFSTRQNITGVIQPWNPNYGSPLNAYGVWNPAPTDFFDKSYSVTFPATGVYTFVAAADSSAVISMDGIARFDVSTAKGTFAQPVTVTAGVHTIRIQAEKKRGSTSGVFPPPPGTYFPKKGSVSLTISGNTTNYSGARGGNAGGSGFSGGGGGSGGATVLFLNGTVIAVAGGGGGGGGGGNGPVGGNAPGPNGRATNPVSSGQNGTNKSGDGGGGGGGGGGYDGGNGGQTPGGDNGGQAGSWGSSYSSNGNAQNPTGRAAAGSGQPYYSNQRAQGGVNGATGTTGFAAIEFGPLNGAYVHTSGSFTEIDNSYIKVNGAWELIKNTYINSNGIWNAIVGSFSPVFTQSTDDFGVNPREADGNAGQGGGGGGSKIICTKLYELGLMDKDIYLADQAFGARLIQSHPDIYNGYRAWAEIVVDWMNGQGPKMMPWMSDQQFSKAAKKWSVSWAQDIATPWAESMAYQIGQRESDNFTGKMITLVGTPICKVVGVWQRVFGHSQQPAGFVKGAMLIPVFVLLKIVAVLGKLIQRR